jgi:hypothetical protein
MRTKRNLITAFLATGLLATATVAGSQEIPNVITLKSLARLYEPVKFDHALHINSLQDCGTCHHHVIGAPSDDRNCGRCHQTMQAQQAAACRKCHAAEPFTAETLKAQQEDKNRYHRDKPGLKAAYHLSCTGCHEKGKGPTGCTDCHARNDAGDQFYRSGKYVPAAKPAKHH